MRASRTLRGGSPRRSSGGGGRLQQQPERQRSALGAPREVRADRLLDLVPQDAAVGADLQLPADELREVERPRVAGLAAQLREEPRRRLVVEGGDRRGPRCASCLGVERRGGQEPIEQVAHDLVLAVAEDVRVRLHLLMEMEVARQLLLVPLLLLERRQESADLAEEVVEAGGECAKRGALAFEAREHRLREALVLSGGDVRGLAAVEEALVAHGDARPVRKASLHAAIGEGAGERAAAPLALPCPRRLEDDGESVRHTNTPSDKMSR